MQSLDLHAVKKWKFVNEMCKVSQGCNQTLRIAICIKVGEDIALNGCAYCMDIGFGFNFSQPNLMYKTFSHNAMDSGIQNAMCMNDMDFAMPS